MSDNTTLEGDELFFKSVIAKRDAAMAEGIAELPGGYLCKATSKVTAKHKHAPELTLNVGQTVYVTENLGDGTVNALFRASNGLYYPITHFRIEFLLIGGAE